MAQLNSSNVVNGNIVESNDILQLYDAFTAGGGTTGVYNVSISGSLTGSATSASYALSSSYALSASFAVSSSRTVTASFAISSSYALSASFATSASLSDVANASIVTDQIKSTVVMPSGSNPQTRPLKVAAGSLFMTGSTATTAISDELNSKVLGTDLFINATIFNASGVGNVTWVRSYNSSTGQIEIRTAGGTGDEFVMWTAYYVPA